MLRLEPAAFGQGEPLVRESEIGDGLQGRPHQAELLLQTGAERRERLGRAIRWSHRIKRRRQQCSAFVRVLARAIGADESERLLSLEAMSLYRLAHGFLGLVVEGAERVRQRHAHRARVYMPGHFLAEPVGQRQSGRHPRRLSAQDVGYSLGAEPVIAAHRMHHPGFVHRSERARRPIRLEQGHLPLQSRNRRLQHHRHLGKPRRPPFFETLETVDDLVIPILCLCHAQRQLPESNRPLGCRFPSGPQRLETRTHPLDGNKPNRGAALSLSLVTPAGQRKRRCHDKRPFAAKRAPSSSADNAGPGDGRDKTCRKPSESYRPNGR